MKIQVSKTYQRDGVRARLMSPMGHYPRTVKGDVDHGYFFHREAVFSVVRVREHPGQYEAYSEMEWAYPEEIALYASIAMAQGNDGPRVILYPLPERRSLEIDPPVPLNDPNLLKAVKGVVVRKWRAHERARRRRWPGIERDAWNAYALPPFMSSGQQYTLTDAMIAERQETLLRAIDPSDFLMIRGLSTWLRSAMLSMHMNFMEEVITTLFISMEASFRLIRRRLISEGVQNPSAKDAADFLGKAFNEEPLERYFAEYYDDRVATLHPESRFGVFPHAPLMADDYYHLRDSLRDLYIYLLAGLIYHDAT